MDIDAFASKNKRRRKTVVKWINCGLIPKAELEKNYVPDSAREPYTKARAKNSNAIYVSMVKASVGRKHILPVIYGLCQDEFEGYVDRLIRAGFIERRISDGITYYDATIKVKDINRKQILSAVADISRGIAEGITTAIVNR